MSQIKRVVVLAPMITLYDLQGGKSELKGITFCVELVSNEGMVGALSKAVQGYLNRLRKKRIVHYSSSVDP